jgi:hypothetical protein
MYVKLCFFKFTSDNIFYGIYNHNFINENSASSFNNKGKKKLTL